MHRLWGIVKRDHYACISGRFYRWDQIAIASNQDGPINLPVCAHSDEIYRDDDIDTLLSKYAIADFLEFPLPELETRQPLER